MFTSYPPEIVCNTQKPKPRETADSVFIRGIDPVKEEDVEFGVFKPRILDKILVPKNPMEIAQLSLSLEGEFKPEYICLKVKSKDWDYKTDINPNSIKFTEINQEPLFINFNMLLNIVKDLTDNDSGEIRKYIINILWNPVDANFYHYQLQIEDFLSKKILNRDKYNGTDKKYSKMIAEQVLYNLIDQNRSIPPELQNT